MTKPVPAAAHHPTILQVLDLSTAHLTPATSDLLERTATCDWPVAGGPIPYGYFIYAHDENDGTIPPDLWACCEYARKHGCWYLRFDQDAAIYPDFPDYLDLW